MNMDIARLLVLARVAPNVMEDIRRRCRRRKKNPPAVSIGGGEEGVKSVSSRDGSCLRGADG
jgi:hypothetical protein